MVVSIVPLQLLPILFHDQVRPLSDLPIEVVLILSLISQQINPVNVRGRFDISPSLSSIGIPQIRASILNTR